MITTNFVPLFPVMSDKDLPFTFQEWNRRMWKELNGTWTDFTPVASGFTVVGTATYTGKYKTFGHLCKFQFQLSASTTIASTAGTSYFEFPVTYTTGTGKSGLVIMMNKTTNISVGTGVIDYTNQRIYVPTQAASANTFTVYGEYEI